MNRTAILVMVMMACVNAFASGTLQIADPKVEGSQVTIPVVLGGDSANAVSAMDFRLSYNPEVLRPVTVSAGVVAEGADKRVMANMSSPGEYVVVVMGMNQNTCSSGEVAKIVMDRVADEPDSNWGLGITRPTLSSVDGAVIASKAMPYEPKSAESGKTPESSETPGKSTRGEVGTGQSVTRAEARAVDVASRQGDASAKPETPAQNVRSELADALANRERARSAVEASGIRESQDVETQTRSEVKVSKAAATDRPGSASAPTKVFAKASDEAVAGTVERVNNQATESVKRSESGVWSSKQVIVAGFVAVVLGAGLAAIWLRRR